jgi:hypothetical protein
MPFKITSPKIKKINKKNFSFKNKDKFLYSKFNFFSYLNQVENNFELEIYENILNHQF